MKLILKYKNLSVYDVKHAIQRFKERFPQYSIGTLKELLKRGIKEIDKLYNLRPDEYMLIYTNRNMKIPFEITDIGKVFTVLKIDYHPFDLRDAIKLIIEIIIRYDLNRNKIIELLNNLKEKSPETLVTEIATDYKIDIIDSMEESGFHFFIEEGKQYKTWKDIYIDDKGGKLNDILF